MVKRKSTNNDLQNIHIQLKIELSMSSTEDVLDLYLKMEVDLLCIHILWELRSWSLHNLYLSYWITYKIECIFT
jgi:hypothetical protein